MKINKLIALAFLCSPFLASAQSWQPKQAKLMTRFAKDVNPANPLPEYPRPQMMRSEWINLNGVWQYQPGKAAGEAAPAGKLNSSILVPFPVESALSGVMEAHDRIWYRRNFTVPASWKNKKILLHFGAVDYEAEVFLNGKSLGVHRGGYDPFSFDITSSLKSAGAQEITVRVYDPTDSAGLPRGKQTLNPRGIMYTCSTGIWQTVWLEPVPVTNIKDIRITPDIDKGIVKVKVMTDGDAAGATVSFTVKDGNKDLQTVNANANEEVSIPVKNAKLWSPDSPFLYDLDIALKRGNKKIDGVGSYFGMRKISVGTEGDYKKLYLNNKFLFQIGPLDQGFWPDGNYTAPTDAAMKYDLEMTKKLGFNMVRKHIKVEPYRWYYYADKMGLLVWQDMPSANSYTRKTPPVDTAAYRSELKRMIETHWNSPSIITWVVFNESQGQHNTPALVDMVRKMDPSRLINQASGGSFFDSGDYLDIHSYPPPAVPENNKKQVLANGEYGGIGYVINGHTWTEHPTYIMIDNEEKYLNLYDDYADDLTFFKTQRGLSAAVYTEITDVEGELNGFLTYDRAVLKGSAEKIRASNEKIIKDQIMLTDVLPSSEFKPRNWKYTIEKPAEEWFTPAFNDASWKTGAAGFGDKGRPARVVPVNTQWTTENIWVRQEFTLGDQGSINKDDLVLYIHADDECEVYINGVKAVATNDTNTGYIILQMSKEGRDAVKFNSKNVIAIHCHQKGRNQFIDAGISVMKSIKGN